VGRSGNQGSQPEVKGKNDIYGTDQPFPIKKRSMLPNYPKWRGNVGRKKVLQGRKQHHKMGNGQVPSPKKGKAPTRRSSLPKTIVRGLDLGKTLLRSNAGGVSTTRLTHS